MIKKVLLSTIILFGALTAIPVMAGENPATKATSPSVSSQLDVVGKAGFGQDSATARERVNPIIQGLINVILSFVGTIAFIVFLIGGFLWLTARGNETQVGKAKQYMFNGTIGIIIIILAYSLSFYLTEVVFKAATG